MDKIRDGVHPNVLLELERVYKYGTPRKVNATNTEENLLQYFLYGNHDTATDNPDEYKKVIIKDYKRGPLFRFCSQLPSHPTGDRKFGRL